MLRQCGSTVLFERRHQPLLASRLFYGRMGRTLLAFFLVITVSLGVGMIGYRVTAGLSWIDAYLNAAMILTGMGPVDHLGTPAGKLFAGAYALFSGVAFLSSVAILAAPIVHRFLHRFHIEAGHK